MNKEEFAELVARSPIIRFNENCEGYAQKGMHARLIAFSNGDDGVVIKVDFKEFELINIPFETNDYYDSSSKPVLSARQAGFYSNIDFYSADDFDEAVKLFTVIDPDITFVPVTYEDEPHDYSPMRNGL